MLGQLLLTSEAFAAEAAETTTGAVANALDTPATGQFFAFAIALTALLVIGTLLFFHRGSRRRARE
jgi:hypothetical protein